MGSHSLTCLVHLGRRGRCECQSECQTTVFDRCSKGMLDPRASKALRRESVGSRDEGLRGEGRHGRACVCVCVHNVIEMKCVCVCVVKPLSSAAADTSFILLVFSVFVQILTCLRGGVFCLHICIYASDTMSACACLCARDNFLPCGLLPICSQC